MVKNDLRPLLNFSLYVRSHKILTILLSLQCHRLTHHREVRHYTFSLCSPQKLLPRRRHSHRGSAQLYFVHVSHYGMLPNRKNRETPPRAGGSN